MKSKFDVFNPNRKLASSLLLACGFVLSPVYATTLGNNLEMSTLMEVEANFTRDKDFGTRDESDIVLATIEMAFDAHVNDRINAHIQFLYEEDDTSFGIDEGIINLKFDDATNVNLGKMYVPFGTFDTYMISDPLTLDLAETNETVVQLAFVKDKAQGSVYLFNGDSLEAGDDDQIAGFGANLNVQADYGINWGVSFISNLGDSDTLQDLGGPGIGVVTDAVAAVGVSGHWADGPVSVVGELVQALDDFAVGDLGGSVTRRSEPSALNIELAYAADNNITYAVGYQTTDEAAFAGLAEERIMVAATTGILEGGAAVGVEYSLSDDYSTADGGTGRDSSQLLMQLAVEF